MGFWTKTSNKIIFLVHLSDQPLLSFAKRQTCSASWNIFEWKLVMRKRSQNHFRLHFTSKTPYLFDVRGILSTSICYVHGRLNSATIATGKAIRKRSWQTIKKRYIIQWNISKDYNLYSRRRLLTVNCVGKFWITNKILQN